LLRIMLFRFTMNNDDDDDDNDDDDDDRGDYITDETDDNDLRVSSA